MKAPTIAPTIGTGAGVFGAVPLAGCGGEVRGARLEAGAGESRADAALAPGRGRVEDDALVVGCGDGLFRATAWTWIDAPVA